MRYTHQLRPFTRIRCSTNGADKQVELSQRGAAKRNTFTPTNQLNV
jgi:hypothetical protein